MYLDYAPGAPRPFTAFFIEERQQAGAYQRRFSATRAANNRYEAAMVQQAVKGEKLLVAAEEKLVVFEAIGPQTRKRTISCKPGTRGGAAHWACGRANCTNGSIASKIGRSSRVIST